MRALAQHSAAVTTAPRQRPPIQRKAQLGPVDDPLEREADRVAEAAVAGRPVGTITSASSNTPQRKCVECEEGERTLRRKEAGEGSVTSQAINAAARAVSNGGNPLTAEQRAHFEPRFGRDLSHVRIHTDQAAAAAAWDINARAFTLGNHVALSAGAGDPREREGQLVLAHELAHVIQQGGQSRALQRWTFCSEANVFAQDCPPRETQEEQRSRAGMVFFSEMRDQGSGRSGALIANFDIGKSAIKPNLAGTLYWQQFLELAQQEQAEYDLVGFSDCHEGDGAKLRADRAEAVRQAVPQAVRPQMKIAEAAPEGQCMTGNVTGADRTMNRSVALVLRQYTADFTDDEDEVIVGKTPQDRLRECQAGARVKTFPFRTTRFGGAPIMAHREGDAIIVKLPMHVKYNGDFRKETDTLPDDTFLGGTELEKNEIVRVRHYELRHWYNFNVTGDASDDKTTDYCVTAEQMLDFAHATEVAFAVNVIATAVDALMIGTPVGKVVGTGVSKLTAPVVNVAKTGLQKTVLGTALSGVLPEVGVSRVTTSLVEGRASSAIIENQIADQAVTRSIASAVGEPLTENLTSSALSSTAPRLGSSFAGDLLPGFGLAGASEFGSSAVKRTWQDFLPQAQERLDASKAQRGIPDYMKGMATPGGPAGYNARRAVIAQLARQGSLNREEMQAFINMLRAEYPILDELTAAQGLAGAAQSTEMLQILDRFTVQTGVEVEVVEDGVVRTATQQPGNFASLRSRPGFLQIERSAYESETQLGREVTHELASYYARSGGASPTLNDTFNALDVLELTIRNGGNFPF